MSNHRFMIKKVLRDIPAKAIGIETGTGPDTWYKAGNGERKLPRNPDVRQKFSGLHPLAGLAIAYEDTQYECFLYEDGDRHIQSLIQKALKEGTEADSTLKEICWKLLGKMRPEDLEPGDIDALKVLVKEVSESIRAKLNLLVGIDEHYELGVISMIKNTEDTRPGKARCLR